MGNGVTHGSRWGDADQTSDFATEIAAEAAEGREISRTRYDQTLNDAEAAYTAKMQRQNDLRKESRQSESVAYRTLRDAHSKGLSAKFPLPTTPQGNIIGSKTKWHAAVRSAAERTLDYSLIREYSRNHHQWKWVLKTIQKELDEMFTFTYPVRTDYLAKYIQDFLTNDRYRWKQHWLESNGGQHESCPDAAFVILEPYWKSVEGRNEAQKMKEKRSLVGKRSRGVAGFPSKPSDQVSP
jgi:hypothetical protein